MRSSRGLFRAIYSRLFEDEDFRPLSKNARLVFLFLRQGRFANAACLMRVDWNTVCEILGLTKVQLRAVLEELTVKPWVKVQRGFGGDVVFIPGGLANDPHISVTNPKHLVAIMHALADIPDCALKKEFLNLYPDVERFLAEKGRLKQPRDDEKGGNGDVSREPEEPEKPTAADVQRYFAKAFQRKTNRRYYCSNYAADIKAGHKLLRNWPYEQVCATIDKAFSGAYFLTLPGSLAEFGHNWNKYIDDNLKPEFKGEGAKPVPLPPQPLTEDKMDEYLSDYLWDGKHTNLIKSQFDEWVRRKELAAHSEELWRYFHANFSRAKADAAKGAEEFHKIRLAMKSNRLAKSPQPPVTKKEEKAR